MPGFEYEVATQGEPVRRFQVKAGDVFAIPLAERQYALALCRFVFQTYKGFTACRIFDAVVPEPKLVGPLPECAAFDPLFVWITPLPTEPGRSLDRAPVDPGPVIYRSAGGIYNGDEYVRRTDYTEDVPNLCLPGPVVVESQLRKHFGLPSVDGAGNGVGSL